MHDVVTHRVSLMVLQAGALRMTAADEATRRAAEDLRVTGCQALDELRTWSGSCARIRKATRRHQRTAWRRWSPSRSAWALRPS